MQGGLEASSLIRVIEKEGGRVFVDPQGRLGVKAPEDVIQRLTPQIKEAKPQIVQALKAREFNRLYALIKASVQRVADVVPEGGFETARRMGVLPRLNALLHKMDEACKALDEPALLWAIEAWEKGWQEMAQTMARQRRMTPLVVEATA